jgi:hypothetical protein
MTTLQPLPDNLEPTRATLHAYAHAVAAIPRAHAIEHPRWWHISLDVTPAGLVTDTMSLPAGGVFSIRMDLRDHDVVVDTSRGEVARLDMQAGTTAKQMGADIIEAVATLGLSGDYDTSRFDDDGPRIYEPATAEAFFAVLADVHQALQTHRATLDGEVGPIQVWPHGFDIAFEWFGTRTVESEEGDETGAHSSQLNLGFYPAGEAYFYSNAWPFDSETLLGVDLPYGAEWHTEGWEGSKLTYDAVAGRPDATDRVTAYAAAVYAAAAPTLLD